MKNIVGMKKLSRMTYVVLLALLSLALMQCKRSLDKEDVYGALNAPASKDFYVINGGNGFSAYAKGTGSPATSVDFKTDSVYFRAKFSEKVSWNLNLKGLQSGAEKTINGVSDTLTMENTLWNGGSNGIPFFIKGEQVVATITFLGSSLSYTDTLSIFATKVYKSVVVNGKKTRINGVIYTPVDDFEEGGESKLTSVSYDAKDYPTVSSLTVNDKKVSGNSSYRMYGTDLNWNSYLISMSPAALWDMYGVVQSLDSNQVYFNIYIYGTGKPNTSVAIQVYETDGQKYSPANSSYDGSINDSYIHHAIVDWTGWKLVSVPYAQFKKANDPKSGGFGNSIKEPRKISAVGISLESYPTAGKSVEAYIDMITITEDGPFVP